MTLAAAPVQPRGFLHDRRRLAVRVVVTVVVGAVLLAVPQIYPRFRIEGQFNVILTYAIAALGLNLLTGYSGQISIGHGAFFGVGAYTTAILVADHGWPHFAHGGGRGRARVRPRGARRAAGPAHPGPLPGSRHPRAGGCLPTRRHPVQQRHRGNAGHAGSPACEPPSGRG